MKHKLILFAAICFVLVKLPVLGFSQTLDAAHSNYVVIGAFASQENATQFLEDVKKLNFKAISAINLNRNLYYVYVLHTENKKAAFIEANRIRKESPFSDTWVYTGLLGSASSRPGLDVNPATEKVITKVEIKDVETPVLEKAEKKTADSAVITSDSSSSQINPVKEVQTKTAPVADAAEGNKNFVFKIFTALDHKELSGDIDVMDVERARKVATFKANQNVLVRQMNKSGKLSLVCEVFGYRVVKKDLNFNRPQDTEGIVLEGNQHIIPFELSRLKKGDFAIMYSVYFYKDAAIMLPESRTEVTSLMEMMKENPKYKIRIHGHTNGGAPGKIISMGESKKFFSLNDTKEAFGSAKMLSEERAKLILEFLVSEGIDVHRMEIKSWGGKRPIYDKLSAQAQSNVRVEIEILDDK